MQKHVDHCKRPHRITRALTIVIFAVASVMLAALAPANFLFPPILMLITLLCIFATALHLHLRNLHNEETFSSPSMPLAHPASLGSTLHSSVLFSRSYSPSFYQSSYPKIICNWAHKSVASSGTELLSGCTLASKFALCAPWHATWQSCIKLAQAEVCPMICPRGQISAAVAAAGIHCKTCHRMHFRAPVADAGNYHSLQLQC
mmetsp:Transcript_54983/g.139686  ORF Transcript_54983/g.139686 Transcript_54983/m.139686 type:complete len:203 (-) Transcript_54983:555-1163(-)